MSPWKKIAFSFLISVLVLTPLTCFLGFGQKERINFLLLGTPGGNYSGSNLSDSLILFSVDPRRRDLAIVSIPRDVWVESSQAKINALYPLGGLGLIEDEVARTLGLKKIDFSLAVDFEGFKKAINLIGGIDVEVDHSFDDFQYPLPGKEDNDCGGDPEYQCRYEHLHFEQGPTHMDGSLALKFARSRYATDPAEGTDFARSKRQQKIVSAFKEKVLSEKLLLRPIVLWGFWEIFQEHLVADLDYRDFLSLPKILLNISWDQPRIFILDWGEQNHGGLLINPPVEEHGGWVLVPRSGDWQEVQREFQRFLNSESQTN